jgi:predicted Zn-dependent peptidase
MDRAETMIRGRFKPRVPAGLCLIVTALFAGPATAQNRGERVEAFRLSNGFRIVVAVRPEIDLLAVNLTVGVGAVDDPPGLSGMAHLLEHASLSGTLQVGSRAPEQEEGALREVDEALAFLTAERAAAAPDPERLEELDQRFREKETAARRLAEPGEPYGRRLEQTGAIGLNATTMADMTQYFCRLPPNSLEEWIRREADRLRHPLLRNFYVERGVVLREVMAATGGRARPQEVFLAQAFPGIPSARPLSGIREQIEAIDRPAAMRYLTAAYRPDRMVLTVVGDADPREVERLSRLHFGSWSPPGPAAGVVRNPAPPGDIGQARVLTFPGPPALVLMGFAAPAPLHPDALALEAIAELLNAEETSPLLEALVRRGRLASAAGCISRYPSARFASVFLLQMVAAPGVNPDRLVHEAEAVLNRLPELPDKDLYGPILRAQLRLAAELADPASLAALLGFNEAANGAWNALFTRLEGLRSLTPIQLRQAARRFFRGSVSPTAESPAF